MNIQAITNLMPKTVMYDSKVNNGQITTNFGLKLDAPIKQDTLSFQGAKVSKVTKKCVNLLKHTVENSETTVAENNGITNICRETDQQSCNSLFEHQYGITDFRGVCCMFYRNGIKNKNCHKCR